MAYSLCEIPNKYNIFATLKRIRMKKQLLLLTAGGMLALASCKNEAPATAGPSDMQIDSMVNARVEEMRTQLMAENDSLINALAQWKADSMIAAMKGTAAPAKAKPVAKKPAAPNKATSGNQPANAAGTTSNAANSGGIQGHSDQNAQGGVKSIKSNSDQSTKSGLKSIKDNADKK
jgi:hypothetical protein